MEPKGNDMADELVDEILAGLELFREHVWHIDMGDDCDQPRVLTQSGKVVAVCDDSDAGLIRAKHIARCSPANIRALLTRLSRSTSTDAVAGPSRRDVANSINRARYGEHQWRARDIEDEDKSSAEYAYRLTDAVFGLFPSLQGGAEPDASADKRCTACAGTGLHKGQFGPLCIRCGGTGVGVLTHSLGETGGTDELVERQLGLDPKKSIAVDREWLNGKLTRLDEITLQIVAAESSLAAERATVAELRARIGRNGLMSCEAILASAMAENRELKLKVAELERDAQRNRREIASLGIAVDAHERRTRYAVDDLSKSEQRVAALVGALKAAEQPLEHASQCLDGIVTHDDEDMTKDGGSATCQAVKKTVDRALKNVRATLATES